MGFVTRSGAAVAVVAVAAATVLTNPVERPEPEALALAAVSSSSTAVNLSAASRALYSWPQLLATAGNSRQSGQAASTAAAQNLASTADRFYASSQLTNSVGALYSRPLVSAPEGNSRRSSDAVSTATSAAVTAVTASALDDIANSFIDFRIAVHNDFVAFASKFGYLGKQLYVAYLSGESIVASLVFNGTDILRGEGLLKNLGDIGGDVALSALFVVIDEGTLASPFTYPVVISRAPVDSPFGWQDADGPYSQLPLRPLPPGAVLTPQTATKKASGATGLAPKTAAPDEFAPKKPAEDDPADVNVTKTTEVDESTSDAPAAQDSGSAVPQHRIPTWTPRAPKTRSTTAVGHDDSPGLPTGKRGLQGRHRLTSDKTASPDTSDSAGMSDGAGMSDRASTKKDTDD